MKRQLGELGEAEEFDCCVIGTGPAGVTCALTLASAGKTVAVLEGGGAEFSPQSQSLYVGTTSGDPYRGLTNSRLRYFGGTSNHWAGWCRPLESWDFESKAAADTGWPIRRKALDPYLLRASEILELPSIPPDRPLDDSGLTHFDFVWSPPLQHLDTYFPVRFCQKYLQIFTAHRFISLFLNSNMVAFETDGYKVTGAKAVDFDGNKMTVRAKTFVLATGGIENNRILLWSNEQAKGELIRNASTLGRYWMEHPHFTLGYGFVSSKLMDDVETSQRRRLFLAPTPKTMDRQKILNCGLRVDRMHDGSREVIEDFAGVAPEVGKQALADFDQGLVQPVRLRAAWEQEPTAVNRVSLTNDPDVTGMPKIELHWQKSELDRRTARVCAQLFGEYLAQHNLGRLRLESWLTDGGDYPSDDELGGNHHMGGTRMADSPDKGIVDNNCKVFGQENLYVAGSSVFPSGGQCNPTMTIVQLSLRLADRINSAIASRSGPASVS